MKHINNYIFFNCYVKNLLIFKLLLKVDIILLRWNYYCLNTCTVLHTVVRVCHGNFFSFLFSFFPLQFVCMRTSFVNIVVFPIHLTPAYWLSTCKLLLTISSVHVICLIGHGYSISWEAINAKMSLNTKVGIFITCRLMIHL